MKKPVGATTLSEYFAQIEEPRKSEIEALHALISKAVPKLKPAIAVGMIGYGSYHYKYASGREGDWPIVALASQKNYISVYVCAVEDGVHLAERHKAELGKVDVGKSCIRFKRLGDINLKILAMIVKKGARMMATKVKTKSAAG